MKSLIRAIFTGTFGERLIRKSFFANSLAFTGVVLLISLLSGCSSPQYKDPHIEIKTKFGVIELELYPDKAPKTVAGFLSYIDSGFFKNTSFYRILNMDNQPSDAPKSELIQGGLYRSAGKKNINPPGLPHETTSQSGLLHTDGTISLARLKPGSASTEFFICVGDQPGFDFGGINNPDGQGYAAFGRVVKGLEIVRKIYNQRENDQYFDPPVTIFDITRL